MDRLAMVPSGRSSDSHVPTAIPDEVGATKSIQISMPSPTHENRDNEIFVPVSGGFSFT